MSIFGYGRLWVSMSVWGYMGDDECLGVYGCLWMAMEVMGVYDCLGIYGLSWVSIFAVSVYGCLGVYI